MASLEWLNCPPPHAYMDSMARGDGNLEWAYLSAMAGWGAPTQYSSDYCWHPQVVAQCAAAMCVY